MAVPIGVGLAGGMLVASAAMLGGFGLRPDLAAAVGSAAYWIKLLYTLALGVAALAATVGLARPGGRVSRSWMAGGVAMAAVAGLAVAQWATAPAEAHRALLLGASADKCPWLIVLLSLPILAGLMAAMRRLAPTRPTLAGFAAGLASGGLGAWIYSFHCDETAIPFLAVWYTLGIAAVGALGAVAGRPLLRW